MTRTLYESDVELKVHEKEKGNAFVVSKNKTQIVFIV